MTIAAVLNGEFRTECPPFEEERLFQTESDTRVLGFCAWQASRLEAPTLVLMHGLTGDADDSYVRGTAHKAFLAGFNTVRLNSRNCGGTRNLTPTIYHMGLTHDMKSVLNELGEKDGLSRLYFGGFSMGANISLKLAGEWKDEVPSYVRGVFAVSPPLEIALSSIAIRQGFFNRRYEQKFLKDLKDLVAEKSERFPQNFSSERLGKVKTLRDFDGGYVAPCFGFFDADDYYERASCGLVVDSIRIPTLVIHALDDPLIPEGPIRAWESRAPEHIHFLISKYGGHVGFVAERSSIKVDSDRYWAEHRIVQFCERLEAQAS